MPIYSHSDPCEMKSVKMSSVLHLVLDGLVQGEKYANDFCCLCLEKADECRFQVSDEITIEIKGEIVVESLSTILETIFGRDIPETVYLLNTVCAECLDSAITSYKFLKKTKGQSEIVHKVLNSLIDCFDTTPDEDEEQKYSSLYLLVKKDLEIHQIYDEMKQSDPKNRALQRFHFIVDKIPSNNSIKKRRDRDYSTIFIKTHELIHDPSKPKEFRCKVCLKLYPSSGSLRQHFFASHFKKDFQCPDCCKCFGTEGLLKTHIAQSHFTVDCEECGKTLRNRVSSLKRHAKSHARELKTCARCGRTYKKIADFEKHVAQETCTHPSKQSRNYHCDHCPYQCHFKHILAQHIKYEHTGAQAHTCKWCGRRCYSQSALRTHILKHTREKNYVCTDCGGRFVSRQSLTHHSRLHNGERPYKCEHCDQRFLSASRRKEHVERKHIDVIYQCNMCDARYNARRSLTKHRKKHMEHIG